MLVKANFIIGHGATARTCRLECFADGDHHADQVVLRKLNDLCNLFWVESNHRAGVVAEGFGGEHEGLGCDADGAKGFVVL